MRVLVFCVVSLFAGCALESTEDYVYVADEGFLITPGQIFTKTVEKVTTRCLCSSGASGQLSCTAVGGQILVSFNKIVPSFEGEVVLGGDAKLSQPGLEALIGKAEVDLEVKGTFTGKGLDFEYELQNAVATRDDRIDSGVLVLKRPNFNGQIKLQIKVNADVDARAGLIMAGADSSGYVTRKYDITQTFQDLPIPIKGPLKEVNQQITDSLTLLAVDVARTTSENLRRQLSGPGQLELPVYVDDATRTSFIVDIKNKLGGLKGRFHLKKPPAATPQVLPNPSCR